MLVIIQTPALKHVASMCSTIVLPDAVGAHVPQIDAGVLAFCRASFNLWAFGYL